jgi:hypothetical protein
MSRKLTFAGIQVAVSNVIAFVLLFSSANPAFASPSPATQEPYSVYTMKPDKGAAGVDQYVTVFSPDCKKQDINEKTKLVSPGNITISDIKAKPGCSLTAKVSIPQGTRVGKLTFLLENKDKDDKDVIIGTAEFEVTGLGIGPVPPGLDPQVDVMWTVMPTAIVRHNFGRQIANNFFGVQIIIVNDSGFNLQIAGIGFKIPGAKNIVPTNSYRATRGTLEKEQQVGIRASVVNAVKSFGLLYSGFLPFWHMPNRKANANLAGEILNGPFEKGLEAVWPDLTVRQLTRLDDQTLRDGLIINNNSQIVTLAWVPKKLLNIASEADDQYLTEYLGRAGAFKADKARPGRDWRDEPQYVNWRLREMVIVGQAIAYINRVQVISTSEGGGVTPPPTARGMNPQTLKRGEESSVIFTGAFLNNATITPPPGVDIKIPTSDIVADKNGFSLRAKIQVGNSVSPGEYLLILNSPGGNTDFKVTVEKSLPTDLKIEGTGYPPAANSEADKTIDIIITGKHLDGAEVRPGVNAKDKLDVSATVNSDDQKFPVKVTVKKDTEGKGGEYDLIVSNPDGNAEQPVKFKVKPKP